MMTAGKTPAPAAHSDIVESELLDMLQTMIDACCGLSAIHQLLDEAKTMAEIRARFAQWQARQRDNNKIAGRELERPRRVKRGRH